jgi:glycosyltransferase involved in cell wall biosynthesis
VACYWKKSMLNKIALINSLSGGGAERQITALVQKGVFEKIYLLTNDVKYKIDKAKYEALYQDAPTIIQKILLLVKTPFILRKKGITKSTKLYCFLQLACFIGFATKMLFGCKFIYCLRTNPFDYYKYNTDKKIPFFLYKFILSRADLILCNSASTTNLVQNWLPNSQVRYTPNGYDVQDIQTKAMAPVDEYRKVFENNIVLLSSGRLDRDKGQWHLIKIYNGFKQKFPTSKLLILGLGPMLDELLALCEVMQLKASTPDNFDAEADIFFCGFISNPYAFYSKAHLFLLTSLFEGLPNTPIESLLSGTPVMLADCKTGPREILLPDSDLTAVATEPINTEAGFLMPPLSSDVSMQQGTQPDEDIWIAKLCDVFSQCGQAKPPSNFSSINDRFDINKVTTFW